MFHSTDQVALDEATEAAAIVALREKFKGRRISKAKYESTSVVHFQIVKENDRRVLRLMKEEAKAA
jgi:hypothetical protein